MNKKLILITALSGLLSFNLFAKTNEETASDAISDSQQKSTGTEFGKAGPGFGLNGLYLLKPHKKIDEMISKESNDYNIYGKWWENLQSEYAKKAEAIGYTFYDLPEKGIYKFMLLPENKLSIIYPLYLDNGWETNALVIGGIVYEFTARKTYDTSNPKLILNAIAKEMGQPNHSTNTSYYYYDDGRSLLQEWSYQYNEIQRVINGKLIADDMYNYFIEIRANKQQDKVSLEIHAAAPKKAFLALDAIDKRGEKFIRALYDKRLQELKKESSSEIIL